MSKFELIYGMFSLKDELTIDGDFIDWYWFVRSVEGKTPEVLYCPEKEQLEKYKVKLEGNLKSGRFDFTETYGNTYTHQSELGPFVLLYETNNGCVDALIFRTANKL
jgi:hypothetical protein